MKTRLSLWSLPYDTFESTVALGVFRLVLGCHGCQVGGASNSSTVFRLYACALSIFNVRQYSHVEDANGGAKGIRSSCPSTWYSGGSPYSTLTVLNLVNHTIIPNIQISNRRHLSNRPFHLLSIKSHTRNRQVWWPNAFPDSNLPQKCLPLWCQRELCLDCGYATFSWLDHDDKC